MKACFLYPPGCACLKPCRCAEFREQIALALDVNFYNQAEDAKTSAEDLRVIQLILGLPNDHFLRRNAAKAYPLWLIEEEFQRREDDNHFRMVSRLIWTWMRLAHTYEVSAVKKRQASMTEALKILLGKTPLKREAKGSYTKSQN